MATTSQSIGTGSLQISEVVDCILCQADKSSHLIQLNCFHACHLSCLKTSLPNPRPGSKFNCSRCNGTNVVPKEGLKGLLEEFLNCKIKEVAAIVSNVSPPCDICKEVGDQNVSTNYCMTCRKYLCEIDTKRHKLHKIITNAEVQSEQYLPQVLTSKRLRCSNHATNTLELYCQECQIPVCHICCVTDHKLHTTICNQDASSKIKQELKEKATGIGPIKCGFEIVANKLEKLLNKIEINMEQQIETCEKWGKDMKKIVNKVVKKKVKIIENMTRTEKNKITLLVQEKNYQNKRCQSTMDYMDIFLKFGSDSDFVQKHKIFLENLDTCLQQDLAFQVKIRKSKAKLNILEEVEKDLDKLIKIETETEICNFQARTTPPGPSASHAKPESLEFKGCEVECVEKINGQRWGVAVDEKEIIVVSEQDIEVYRMTGKKKGQIKCLELRYATDIEIANNKIYLADCSQSVVLVLDRMGKTERTIDLTMEERRLQHAYARGLAVDHVKEDIYIACAGTKTVYKCSKGTTTVQPFITSEWRYPQYICVTPNHEVIVSYYHSHTVCKYDNKGNVVWRYGNEGWGHEEFMGPKGVCVDSWGHIFVCDCYNNRIHHLSPEGTFLSYIDGIDSPLGMKFINKKLIITCGGEPSHIVVLKCHYE